ncbi:MAG TPA: divalent metal cation transporter [Vicinamibacterales bacterium]|nr:divalent metal cation transporter [Vicinamibacterales bacterium]
MKNLAKIGLGVLTSIGGFLEAGSIGTALEAGAAFRFQLLWALALGVICVAFLTEMTGRLAAVSGRTVVDAMRKRFGFRVHAWPLGAQVVLNLFVLASEIGGASFALQMATGVSMSIWALPVTAGIWIVLWRARFGQIEHSMAALGLVTLCFVVAAVRLHPDWTKAAVGLLPAVPADQPAHYAYLAVSIIGASVSPYLVTFYSSGAVEEKWTTKDLMPNRIVAAIGMGFGSAVAAAVMIVAAVVIAPRTAHLTSFDQAAGVLVPALGRAGFWLFCASLFIGCVGAAFELALDLGYNVAQSMGWEWSESRKQWTEVRFSLVYTGALAVAVLPSLFAVNPFQLTLLSMALTALALPLVIGPLLIVMNDQTYLKQHTNGLISNTAVAAIAILTLVLALVAVPLQIAGG